MKKKWFFRVCLSSFTCVLREKKFFCLNKKMEIEIKRVL